MTKSERDSLIQRINNWAENGMSLMAEIKTTDLAEYKLVTDEVGSAIDKIYDINKSIVGKVLWGMHMGYKFPKDK